MDAPNGEDAMPATSNTCRGMAGNVDGTAASWLPESCCFEPMLRPQCKFILTSVFQGPGDLASLSFAHTKANRKSATHTKALKTVLHACTRFVECCAAFVSALPLHSSSVDW